MKKTYGLFFILFACFTSYGQLKAKPSCGIFSVDILNGNVNNMKPDVSAAEIKEKLPCFTSSEEDGSSAKCGGGVFYKDRDIYFYTQRDYVEIGEKFTGKLSIPLMGQSRKNLFQFLGNPKIKDDNWDAFEMAYGTLVLHYNPAGKVKLIQFSTKGVDTLSLCE